MAKVTVEMYAATRYFAVTLINGREYIITEAWSGNPDSSVYEVFDENGEDVHGKDRDETLEVFNKER